MGYGGRPPSSVSDSQLDNCSGAGWIEDTLGLPTFLFLVLGKGVGCGFSSPAFFAYRVGQRSGQ